MRRSATNCAAGRQARSRPPRRSLRRAGETSGSGCASCRRRANRNRTPRPRSRSRRDRGRRSARPARRRRRRRACRFASRARRAASAAMSLLMIGGDALEPADRDRLLLEPSPAAGGLARTVAGAPQNPGEHVRLPVDHIGAVIVARRDLADIFGDRRMRRARPLAIDHFVKVARDPRRPSASRPSRPSARSRDANLVRIHVLRQPSDKTY